MSIKRDGGNNIIPRSKSDLIIQIKSDHAKDPMYKDESICKFLIEKELKTWFAPFTMPCGRVISTITKELLYEHMASFFSNNPIKSLSQVLTSLNKNDYGSIYYKSSDYFADKELEDMIVDISFYDKNTGSLLSAGDGIPNHAIPIKIATVAGDNTKLEITLDIIIKFKLTFLSKAMNQPPIEFKYSSPKYTVTLDRPLYNNNTIDDQYITEIIRPDGALIKDIEFNDVSSYIYYIKEALSAEEIASTTYLSQAINCYENKNWVDKNDFFTTYHITGKATIKVKLYASDYNKGYEAKEILRNNIHLLTLLGRQEPVDITSGSNSYSTTWKHALELIGAVNINTTSWSSGFFNNDYLGLTGRKVAYCDTEFFDLGKNAVAAAEEKFASGDRTPLEDATGSIISSISLDLVKLCEYIGFYDVPTEYVTRAIYSKTKPNVSIITSSSPYAVAFTGVGDSALSSNLSVVTFTGKDISEEFLKAVDNWLAPLKKESVLTKKYGTVKVSAEQTGSDYITTIESLITPEDIIASFSECKGSKFDSKELKDAFNDANYKISGKNIKDNVNNIMAAAMSQAGIVGQFAGIPNEVLGGLTDKDKVMTAISEKVKQNKLAQARNKVDSLQYHTTMRNPATTFSSKMQKLDVDASMNIDKRERNEYGALGPLGLVEKVDSPASLRIYRQDNTTAGSSGIDQIYVDCFLLTDVQEVDEEKYSIFQSLNGDTLVQFFGRRPTTLNLSGILMDTKNQQWYNDFKYWYDNYLRGSAAIKNDSRIVLVYTDQIIEGFILSMNVQKNATTNMSVHVNFTMLVVSHTPLATEWTDPEHSEIDRGYHRIQAHPDVDPDAESRFAAFMETVSGDLISDAALEDVAAKKDAAIDKEVKKTKLYGVLDYSSGSTIQSQAFNSRLFDPKLDISLSEVNPSLIASAKVQSSTGGNLSNAVNSEDTSGIKMSDFKLTLNAENGARNYRNMQEKSILDQVSYRILS